MSDYRETEQHSPQRDGDEDLAELLSRSSASLSHEALDAIQRLIPRSRGGAPPAYPGLPAYKQRLGRGWSKQPFVLPSTAGVRFVNPKAFGEGRDPGSARPEPAGPVGARTTPVVSMVLRDRAVASTEPHAKRLSKLLDGLEGVRATASPGGAVSIRATLDAARALNKRVLQGNEWHLARSRPLLPCVGPAVLGPHAGLDRLHRQGGVDGRGVLVGIADFRIDFYHSNLRDADGRTRIAALWDQEAVWDPDLSTHGTPGPGGLGVVYTAEDIDRELLGDQAPYSVVPHNWVVADGSTVQEVHGTHVAAMAIASGVSDKVPQVGAAPGARLLFVNLLPELGLAREGVRYDYAMEENILAAVAWMDQVARSGVPGVTRGNRPLVVSLSLADYTGTQRGLGLTRDLVQTLLRRDNRALCVASGNGDDRSVHATANLQDGAPVTIRLEYGDLPVDSDRIVVYSPSFPVKVAVKAPDLGGGAATVEAVAGQAKSMSLHHGGSPLCAVMLEAAAHPLEGGDHRVIVDLEGAPGKSKPLKGTWELVLTRQGFSGDREPPGLDNLVELYGSIANDGRRKFIPHEEGRRTVNDIASAELAITVGAHLSPIGEDQRRHIWADSGRGPNRAQVMKPELAAPGANVYTSQPHGRWSLADKALHTETITSGLLSGTSLATPVVAGALACWMQQQGLADGETLDIEQIRAGFLKATSRDQAYMEGLDQSALQGPRFTEKAKRAFGRGYLDATRLIEEEEPS